MASIASPSVRLWLTVSLILVLLLAAVAYSQLPGVRQKGTFPNDPPTPYFHYLPSSPEHGRVLVIHGLDANKELMNLLCYALGDAGFDVYSIDMPGHGDSPVGFNAVRAREAVQSALDILGPHTIVIGHSMGGALLLDLAADTPFEQMILLSPAPTPVDRIRAERLLVLTGQFDIPRVRSFVPKLENAGVKNVEQRTIPWAGHSGYLAEPEPIREIVSWLGGDTAKLTTVRRLGLLICVILVALGLGILSLPGSDIPKGEIIGSTVIVSYVASFTVALFISALMVVLRGLRLFSTDYLISFVFLAGITRLPACLRKVSFNPRKTLVSLLATTFVIVVAVLAGSELVHMRLAG